MSWPLQLHPQPVKEEMIPTLSSPCFSVENLSREIWIIPVLSMQKVIISVSSPCCCNGWVREDDVSSSLVKPTNRFVEGCSLMRRAYINSKEVLRSCVLQFSVSGVSQNGLCFLVCMSWSHIELKARLVLVLCYSGNTTFCSKYKHLVRERKTSTIKYEV